MLEPTPDHLCLGMLYCGAYAQNEKEPDVYVAYNFLAAATELALPKPRKGKEWVVCIDSGEEDAAFGRTKARKRRKNHSPATDHLCAGEQGDEKTWVMHGNIFAQLHITKIWCLSVALRSDYTGRGCCMIFQNILRRNFWSVANIIRNHESEQCRAEGKGVFPGVAASQRTQ